jgi:hypothetical protein
VCGMRVENNQGIKSCMRVSVRGERFGNMHKVERFDLHYTANEGPVRIQYKCLVAIDVFPEIKLFFPKQNYNVLSPSSYTRVRHVTGNDQDYLGESPERLFRYLRFSKKATIGVRATYATR